VGKIEDSVLLEDDDRESVAKFLEESRFKIEQREEPHTRYVYVLEDDNGKRLLVRQYKNGRLHMQGSSELIHGEISRQLGVTTQGAVLPANDDQLDIQYPHIGSDEAGKGDVFGPLVVSAVYLTKQAADHLAEASIADSKKMSDSRCREVSKEIRKLEGAEFATRVLMPVQYNSLYQQFCRKNGNLNNLLASEHGKSIDTLARKSREQLVTVVVDKFADEQILDRYTCSEEINLIQVEKGERDLAVAAASILARAEFLRRLKHLSDVVGQQLPKGAGQPTVEVGINLCKRWGQRPLSMLAKTHFKNVKLMTE